MINACDSHQVAQDIPPTIGMSDRVADAAAIGFYEGLGFGKPIETAFKIALAGLGDQDDQVPQLFPPATKDVHDRRKLPLIEP